MLIRCSPAGSDSIPGTTSEVELQKSYFGILLNMYILDPCRVDTDPNQMLDHEIKVDPSSVDPIQELDTSMDPNVSPVLNRDLAFLFHI